MSNRPRRSFISTSSLEIMGVPRRFSGYAMDDFKTFGDAGLEKVAVFVRNYISKLELNFRGGVGIFFCGSNGVGKSMLSCIILKEAYALRYSCRRVTFSKYIDIYASGWDIRDHDRRETAEQDFHEEYMGAEFLVLEEVGKERDTKLAKPVLEELLRYREEHCYPTIICTNLDSKDFKEAYGNSVASLVNGCMTVVRIVADDRRKA